MGRTFATVNHSEIILYIHLVCPEKMSMGDFPRGCPWIEAQGECLEFSWGFKNENCYVLGSLTARTTARD